MKIICNKCGKKFDYDKYYGICPKCGRYNNPKYSKNDCVINGQVYDEHKDEHVQAQISSNENNQFSNYYDNKDKIYHREDLDIEQLTEEQKNQSEKIRKIILGIIGFVWFMPFIIQIIIIVISLFFELFIL